uniref:B30.2/SPRY domain-containing protein n=1 Tax=Calidris pygmaea TaxID=425635 RepID=A0A8C3PSS3_9CHAR
MFMSNACCSTWAQVTPVWGTCKGCDMISHPLFTSLTILPDAMRHFRGGVFESLCIWCVLTTLSAFHRWEIWAAEAGGIWGKMTTSEWRKRDGKGTNGRGNNRKKPQRSRPCPFCSLWHDLIIAEDVSLDADTAHPRLEVSDDGKSVKDTGTIRNVPRNEKRFDSHLYVLAKEGYTSGRHYWEVDVGKRRSWAFGIARESVTRKGTLTLSPKNGLWVMGCTEGREHWVYTEPWTRLSVGGKLPKIGVFLDISAKQLSFYNVHKKAALYTFTIADGSSREGKLLPFFSTGSATANAGLEVMKRL